MRELHTTSEIMDALGGTQAVADLTGRKYSAAFNWRTIGAFPANTYVVLWTALHERGYSAHPRLWGMKEPERAS
jgi:hypothetical protein